MLNRSLLSCGLWWVYFARMSVGMSIDDGSFPLIVAVNDSFFMSRVRLELMGYYVIGGVR